jgi:hypothetical protein
VRAGESPISKGMIERKEPFWTYAFEVACARNNIDHRLTKPKHPWTQWAGRAHEPHHQGRDRQTLPLRNPQ